MCPSSSLPSSLLASYLFSNCFELSHLSVSTSCWFHILPFLVQTVDTVQLSLFAALLFYCPCLTSALLNPSLCVLNHPTPPSPPGPLCTAADKHVTNHDTPAELVGSPCYQESFMSFYLPQVDVVCSLIFSAIYSTSIYSVLSRCEALLV